MRDAGLYVRADWRLLLRTAVALLVAVVVVRFVARQWDAIRASAAMLRPQWGGLLLASGCVLVGYAVLIGAWRMLLKQWNSPIALFDATRIWFVASLGKYIPGKVWSIAAMAVLARDAGASPIAATGSSIIMTLVSIAAGFAVIALAGAGQLFEAYPLLRAGAVGTLVVTAIGLAFGPQLLARGVALMSRVLRRPEPAMPAPSRTTLLTVFAANVAAWIAYGVAFGLFWSSLLGRGGGVSSAALAVYTASYLLGFLALVVPGGLGVREAVLTGLLITLRLATPADAALLAAASRIWLTVLEVLPGLVFLPGASLRRRISSSPPDGPPA